MGHAIVEEGDRKPFRAYMLGIEWVYEIEGDGGAVVFPSVDCLYRYHSMSYFKEGRDYPQDGIVEVEIKFVRHIPAEKCWEEKEKNG